MATLWSVADATTASLLASYYEPRGGDSRMSKAPAMRQAQLSLLSGTLKPTGEPSDRGAVPPGGAQSTAPRFTAPANAPYAHPYYWAPFVLMGNWR